MQPHLINYMIYNSNDLANNLLIIYSIFISSLTQNTHSTMEFMMDIPVMLNPNMKPEMVMLLKDNTPLSNQTVQFVP